MIKISGLHIVLVAALIAHVRPYIHDITPLFTACILQSLTENSLQSKPNGKFRPPCLVCFWRLRQIKGSSFLADIIGLHICHNARQLFLFLKLLAMVHAAFRPALKIFLQRYPFYYCLYCLNCVFNSLTVDLICWHIWLCTRTFHCIVSYRYSPRENVGVCFYRHWFVCLSVTTITKTIVDGFVPNFMRRFLGEREEQVSVSLRSVEGCGSNGQKLP